MRNLWKEFREFALQGNLIDLALGLVIGGAGAGIINSLVQDVLLKRIRMAMAGTDVDKLPPVDWPAVGGSIVTFLLTSAIVFVIVKGVNKMRKGKDEEPVEKLCPHCFFNIPIQATRCGHCTSQLTPQETNA